MTTFARSLALEWRRLRTIRSTGAISGLCVLASGGLGAAIAATADRPADVDLAAAVINPGQPAPTAILLGVLGILAWGHDYRFGTIRPVLSVLPRRGILAAARFTVMSLWITLVASAAVAAAWGVGVVASGGDLARFVDAAPIPRMLLGSVVLGVGCGWIGLGLGALVRSMPAAVVALFAFPAMIEPLGAMVLGQLQAGSQVWLPFGAVGQVVAQSPALDGPPPVAGATIFLASALGLIAVSVRVFTRRDV